MVDSLDAETQLAEERLGRVLAGKWTLERLLGLGGMAAVYEARAEGGARAAVKVLHAEMGRRADIRQRFAQEGMAATRVSHPSVVRMMESGEDPSGDAYLVMELLDGEPLSAVLKRSGTLALPRLVDVMDQVLDVLATAHAQGIVHRDLKPDNLFVTAGGRIKVLDFGIARILDDVPGAYKTKTNVTLGTVPFMSPEQALGKRDKVDGRSDIFSLGAMIFRIVAGRNVHEGDSDAEVLVAMASKAAPPLATVAPKADPGLCAIVDVALAFSKESRYADARTMQEDVRALAEGRDPPHASRVHKAREMSTRIDMVAPVIPGSATVRETVPEATAATQPMRIPSATPLAPNSGPTEVAGGPDTAPPSSLRAMDIPIRPDAAHTAKTKENPAFSAPTAQMPAARDPRAPTMVSGPPVVPGGAAPRAPSKLRPAFLIGGASLLIGLGAGAFVVSRTTDTPAPEGSAIPPTATLADSKAAAPPLPTQGAPADPRAAATPVPATAAAAIPGAPGGPVPAEGVAGAPAPVTTTPVAASPSPSPAPAAPGAPPPAAALAPRPAALAPPPAVAPAPAAPAPAGAPVAPSAAAPEPPAKPLPPLPRDPTTIAPVPKPAPAPAAPDDDPKKGRGRRGRDKDR